MAERNRSTFDFSDQYGSDPISRRYSRTGYVGSRLGEAEMMRAGASAELAEANLAKVRAELDAQLAPMRTATEAVTGLSNLIKTRSTLQQEANIQRGASAIAEGIGQASDLKSLMSLGQSNLLGLKDEVVGPQFRSKALDLFRAATANAANPFEVDRAFSEIDPALAAEPEMQTAYNNAKAQADMRFKVSTAFAATPSLGAVPTLPTGGIDVAAGVTGMAVQEAKQRRAEEARTTLKVAQTQIGLLENKINTAEMNGVPPLPEDVEQLQSLRENSASLINEIFGGTAPQTGPETAEDELGAFLPQGATAPTTTPEVSGSTQAAAASAAATGGATPAPVTAPAATPTPTTAPVAETPRPLSLEEEAAQEAERARQAAIAASLGPIAKRKDEERAARTQKAEQRLKRKNLRDEKSRLRKTIYDGNKLKLGLTDNSDIVQRVLSRIAEIDQELGE